MSDQRGLVGKIEDLMRDLAAGDTGIVSGRMAELRADEIGWMLTHLEEHRPPPSGTRNVLILCLRGLQSPGDFPP